MMSTESNDGFNRSRRDMLKVVDLLLDGNRATGAVCHTSKEGRPITIKAKSVILATAAGGYKPNGFPLSSLTFDGKAMVHKQGIPPSAPMAMTSKGKRMVRREKGDTNGE